MITKEQAIEAGEKGYEFHAGECQQLIGPRGGLTHKVERWRANGRCKTWKTRPAEFSLPVKYGYRGPHTYITDRNAADFHLGMECQPTVYNT